MFTIYPDISKLFDEQIPSPDSISFSNSTTSNSNNMSLSIEIAEKLLIRFDGTKSKLYEFIDNCDKAYNLVNPQSKAILLAIIETKLTDKARAITRNRTFDAWKDLKDFLLDAYSERRTEGQWQLELHSLRQMPSENVMSFSNKVENCYIKLINTLDPNLSPDARNACTKLLKNQALNVFIRGLNKDLSILIKARNPDSLEKAVAVAVAEEQEQLSRQEIFRPFCNICKRNNHSSNNCRYKNNLDRNIRHFQNSSFQNQKYPNTNLQKPNFQNRNYKPSNSNSNSDFPPNLRKDYTNTSPRFCRYCKNRGHVIEECRKREFNNKNKNPTNPLNLQNPRQAAVDSRGVRSVQAVSQPSTSQSLPM
ncbi:uncharacterized protein LOC126893387 [Diabrotica virgifera virgifera]|uniref:Uncharacterized protein n=1 Tax=Diabrotica virgifera virgifera TaxID=50390 RepID=A0ABM5LAL0_DIAVI|nr:uncharacterized protein LOC126893387 [Diabrotica virgifera virgifera]